MDREKIQKALECLAQDHATCSCGECEYWDSRLGYDECERRMAPDIITLLKEQPEIVRCISCTFYRSDGKCVLHNGKWRPEGFCSWAIRKEGR